MKPYFPLMLNLENRRVLVVGGGPVALRKTRLLLQHGARPLVVAPVLDSGFKSLLVSGKVRRLARCFEERDLTGVRLVVAATSTPAMNRKVETAARRRGVWVVRCDKGQGLRGAAFAGSVRRGPLVFAVSTSGLCPALSGFLSRKLSMDFAPSWEYAVKRLGGVRRELQEKAVTGTTRELFWKRLLTGPAVGYLLAGNDAGFENEVKRCICSFSE